MLFVEQVARPGRNLELGVALERDVGERQAGIHQEGRVGQRRVAGLGMIAIAAIGIDMGAQRRPVERQAIVDRAAEGVLGRVDHEHGLQRIAGKGVGRLCQIALGIGIGGGQRQPLDRHDHQIRLEALDRAMAVDIDGLDRGAGRAARHFGQHRVEVDLLILVDRLVGGEVQPDMTVEKLALEADFGGFDLFGLIGAIGDGAGIGAAGAIGYPPFAIEMDIVGRVERQSDGRVDPAAGNVETEILVDAIDLEQVAALLVAGIARAAGQVQRIVEDRRGPGRLAIEGEAVRLGVAGTVGIGRDLAGFQRRQAGRRVGRSCAPLHGVGRPGPILALFMIIIGAGDEIDARERAHQLHFLAELILFETREAVARKLGIGGEGPLMRAAIVILALAQFAIGSDGAQVDAIGDLPVHMQRMTMGLADALLDRHADIGGPGAIGLDLDHVRDRQTVRLAQHLEIIGRAGVVGGVEIILGGEAAARFPEDRAVHAALVELVIILLARHRIVGGAAALGDQRVQLDAEIGEAGQVEMGFDLVAVIVHDAHGLAEVKLAARLPADDAERAAGLVAAEQRALRPLQHLDPFDVEQSRAQPLRPAEIDAVNIDADARVAAGLVGVERHDAANADGQRGIARGEGGDAQRGHSAVAQILQAHHAARLEIIAAQHRNGDRRLLQIGLGLLRGDDNRTKAGIPFVKRRVLRMGRGREARPHQPRPHQHGAGQNECATAQDRRTFHDAYPPNDVEFGGAVRTSVCIRSYICISVR